MSTPRILILAGAPHPKALVQSIDAAAGVCVFAWLNAEGARVDSGGSVAKFTVSWEPGELPDERVYLDPTDAELAEAIANPPADPAPAPHRVLKDTLWMRIKAAGKQAEAVTAISSLGLSQRLDWDSQSWFWSDNPAIRLVCEQAIGIDPDEALAFDPLAP